MTENLTSTKEVIVVKEYIDKPGDSIFTPRGSVIDMQTFDDDANMILMKIAVDKIVANDIIGVTAVLSTVGRVKYDIDPLFYVIEVNSHLQGFFGNLAPSFAYKVLPGSFDNIVRILNIKPIYKLT